jgi:hypothetical protein
MIKCDNCYKAAAYTCADPGLNPVNYCLDCFPVWLQPRAEAGHFPLAALPSVEEEVVEEAPVAKTKKKAAPSDANN